MKKNLFVHSTWGFTASNLGEGALRIHTKRKKDSVSFDYELVKADDIRKVTQEIQTVISDFSDLMKIVKDKGLVVFSSFVKI